MLSNETKLKLTISSEYYFIIMYNKYYWGQKPTYVRQLSISDGVLMMSLMLGRRNIRPVLLCFQ